MIRHARKYLIIALVLAATLFMGVSESKAHWWRNAGYWGYSSYYTPYWGTSWYGAAYRPMHVGHLYRSAYRWGYAGWGCGSYCGSCYSPCYSSYCGSCCSTPSYTTSYYTSSCCGSTTVPTYQSTTPTYQSTPSIRSDATPTPAPTQPAPAPRAPAPQPPTTQTKAPIGADAGLLTIVVPADARVTINGFETKSTGSMREYVSNGLKPGFSYKYEVLAMVIRDGKIVEDVQQVYLTAGATRSVAFNFDAKPAQQLAQIW